MVPEVIPEPLVPPAPTEDPRHPTMAARREDAEEIPTPDARVVRTITAELVPQVVHRTPPIAAFASVGGGYVVSGRRVSIVELPSGAVRSWTERFPENPRPRYVELARDGTLLALDDGVYADPYEDDLVVESPDGERHVLSVMEGSLATLIAGGVAAADTILHLHTADLASERTVELDWTGRAVHLEVSTDGRWIAVESEAGDVRVVELATGTIVARLHAEPWARLTTLRAAEAAARAAETDDEDEEEEEGEDEEAPPSTPLSAHRMWHALVFAPNGSHFAAVRADGLVRVLDLATSHLLASIEPTEGTTDVEEAAFTDDGGTLVLSSSTSDVSGVVGATVTVGAGRAFDAATGAPVEPVPPVSEAALVPRPTPDVAPLLAAPLGGEHSIWHAPPVPGSDTFLLTGRFGAYVVGTDVMRAVDCVDGESAVHFEARTTTLVQPHGLCDVATGHGDVFHPLGDDEDPDDGGDYAEIEEEPEITTERGQLAVLGRDRRRTRVPGTSAADEENAHVVEVSGERLLVVDDGASARVFQLAPRAGLSLTLAAGELPYGRLGSAVLVTSETAWRVMDEEGHELARLPLDEGHAGVSPEPCVSDGSDGGQTIAVGIGALLHVFDGTWHETRTFAMPAADGACVRGDNVLVGRTSVVEVWSLTEEARLAVWHVDGPTSLSAGIGTRLRDDTHEVDVIDLVSGRVLRTFAAAGVVNGSETEELSEDGRFFTWPEGVVAHVVRTSDGAHVRIGILHVGRVAHPYVVADDGAFDSPAAALSLFRVRESGPVRTAHLADAAETRARFYRPSLFDDFLRGRPIPPAGPAGVVPVPKE